MALIFFLPPILEMLCFLSSTPYFSRLSPLPLSASVLVHVEDVSGYLALPPLLPSVVQWLSARHACPLPVTIVQAVRGGGKVSCVWEVERDGREAPGLDSLERAGGDARCEDRGRSCKMLYGWVGTTAGRGHQWEVGLGTA